MKNYPSEDPLYGWDQVNPYKKAEGPDPLTEMLSRIRVLEHEVEEMKKLFFVSSERRQ